MDVEDLAQNPQDPVSVVVIVGMVRSVIVVVFVGGLGVRVIVSIVVVVGMAVIVSVFVFLFLAVGMIVVVGAIIPLVVAEHRLDGRVIVSVSARVAVVMPAVRMIALGMALLAFPFHWYAPWPQPEVQEEKGIVNQDSRGESWFTMPFSSWTSG